MTNDNRNLRPHEPSAAAFSQALAAGDPQEVKALIALGADLHYRLDEGYDALVNAVHGRNVFLDERLIDLLQVLIDHGAELSNVTSYGESGLRVLSRLGRFDAVRLLLNAGADESQLEWTPLIKSVALGTLDEVQALLAAGAPLEDRDRWSRTAWLVALQVGDLGKATLLRDSGADMDAVGRCGTPPLFYPIQCRRTNVLRWLLDLAFDVERTDEFGATALIEAVEQGHDEGVELLLQAGAAVDREHHGGTALGAARSRRMVIRLLDANANPRYLSSEGRRALVGLPADADESLLDGVTADEFLRVRGRRFGASNPERMDERFWLGMIRSGITGYQANERFKGPSSFRGQPVWCAQRFGQSTTLLPDGRVVQIAGEHEDHYDPDFCIYNDVFVHDPDGTIHVYGYPPHVFPPTDFHTATLIGDAIYIVGSLGYSTQRMHGRTPVYRLDTQSWRIRPVQASGTDPGWINGHRATQLSIHEIRVSEGRVLTLEGDEEKQSGNVGAFVLDIERGVWRKLPA
ncbi:ankyrin repeat domain-containing protein [Rhizobacter sp. Root1221]|uniref:ankyrin repeat domain-containing protein n=1 Tax=Rhizobacter sp. Root1221 TaxID=1736433 RepID=UPI0009E854B0|nr:ankyrin repeat domain-containing protein [Rhizobacter sp. Root1221]